MESGMHFSLAREGRHFCTLRCKARPSNASGSRRPPECLNSLRCSGPSLLWGCQFTQHCTLQDRNMVQEQPCLLNEVFGSSFSSPCTLQKIQQQVQRGEKETRRSEVNLSLIVKLTRENSFPLLTWKHWSVLICSAKMEISMGMHMGTACPRNTFKVTGQHMVYLDELIVLHIVQSVWSIATSYNRGVGQDISTTSPALKFKLENRFREEKTVSTADYLPWGYYKSRPTSLFLLCMTQSDIAEWIHYMKTA